MRFILFCNAFKLKRQCFIMRLNVLKPEFNILTCEEKLSFILCPPTIDIAKCVSKFLGIMTNIRKEIDMGLNPLDLTLFLTACVAPIISRGFGQGVRIDLEALWGPKHTPCIAFRSPY